MKTDHHLTVPFEHPRGELSRSAATLVDAPPARRKALAAEDVTVVYGSRAQGFALAGMAVSRAVDVLAPILGMEPGRPALVNGARARGSQRLGTGDTLELVRVAGEKG